MQPPRQVAAPPKGSISVGWLWVSFLNMTSHSSVMKRVTECQFGEGLGFGWRLEISTGTTMQAALTSSETSRLSSSPEARSSRMPMQGDVHQGDRLVVAAELARVVR